MGVSLPPRGNVCDANNGNSHKRRLSSLLNAIILVVTIQQHVAMAFQNSYASQRQSSMTWNTNTHRGVMNVPRSPHPPHASDESLSTTRRKHQPLHALLQESDQREKKRDGASSAPSSTGDEGPKDDFTLHIGRALDTLRNEYPNLLTQSPDYTLYDDHVCLCVDLPTSPLTALTYNSVSGLSRYKMVWDMIHGVIALMYNVDQSYMSSIKLCHDRVRGNVVRVQWHAVLFPRWQKQEHHHQQHVQSAADSSPAAVFGQPHPPPPSSKCHHVDGISVYELDWTTGKIIQHRVEQLVYTNNAQPIMVMDEVMLRQAAKVVGGGIPVRMVESDDSYNLNRQSSSNTPEDIGSFMVEFRPPMFNSFRPSSLFAMEAEQPSKLQPSTAANKISSSNDVMSTTTPTNNKIDVSAVDEASSKSSASASGDAGVVVTMIDTVAFDAKNKSRQKFGLKPLSVEEFLNIEHQVEQLAHAQQEAIKEAKLLSQQQQAEKEAATGPSLFDKVFGSVMKNLDTCESNFDCERPQVCCDYIFAKKCCTSGSPILSNTSKQLQYARIPVYGGDNKPFPPQQQYPPAQRYIQQ